MTAEFAIVVSAALVVLALCIGALHVTALKIRVTDAAADAARTLARGDDVDLAASRVSALVPGASLSVSASGEFTCATVSIAASVVPVTVSARGCALAGGL